MTGRRGIDAKFDRAHELLNEIAALGMGLATSGIYSAEIVDRADGSSDAVARIRGEPPARLSLLIGDMAHNTRSALDHLAFSMVAAAKGNVAAAYFPISTLEKDWEEQAERQLPGVSREVRNQVKALRPWKGGHESFYLLHRLDIGDKHRQVVATAGSASRLMSDPNLMMQALMADDLRKMFGDDEIPQFELDVLRAARPQFPLKDGDVLFSVPPGDYNNDEMMAAHKFGVEVVFGPEEILAGKSIVDELARILSTTRAAVEPLVQLVT